MKWKPNIFGVEAYARLIASKLRSVMGVKVEDAIQIKGFVTIWQGEGEDKKILVKDAENSFVDAGLKNLVSALVGGYLSIYDNTSGAPNPCYICGGAYNWNMYVGQDITTVTTHGMTALTTPIGTPPGTVATTKQGFDLTNPTSGTFRIKLVAVWHPGALSGTCGEAALYFGVFTDTTYQWANDLSNTTYTYNAAMVTRLCHADGDFTGFSIDTAKSLTIEWRIEVSFA